MGTVWLQNMLRIPPSINKNEEKMKQIPYPMLELNIHVTEKTVQAGALIGGWVVPVVVHIFRRTTPLLDKMRRYGRNGMLIGLPLGPLMTYARLTSAKADDAGVYDRCYRLRYNETQLNVDRASIVGGVLGFVLSRGWLGISTGVNVGVVAAAIYNSQVRPGHSKNEKEEEKKKD